MNVKATAAVAVAATALLGVICVIVIWALWGGGGPLLWANAIRPAYIPADYEQSGNTFCSPVTEGAFDQVCLTVMGPWTHDPEEAYGGSHEEYVAIAAMTDCDALQAYVEQTEAQIREGGPLAGRGPVPEQGYILAAGLRQGDLHCYD